MNEIIEIKRKEYEVIEKLGDRSYKVMRKGEYFFLKKFEMDSEGFEAFTDAEHKLRVSGVTNPKCFIYDKKPRISVVDFIEGETCLDMLMKGELPEEVLELMFKAFWYAKNDRMALDMQPHNFKYVNGKLYYLPFKVSKFISNDKFVQNDIRLWFHTKEFIRYAHSQGYSPNESILKSDYETNKNIALMTVKYYR